MRSFRLGSAAPASQSAVKPPEALRADTRTEGDAGAVADVGLELIPRALVVADLLTVRTDGQHALQRRDFGGPLRDPSFELRVGAPAEAEDYAKHGEEDEGDLRCRCQKREVHNRGRQYLPERQERVVRPLAQSACEQREEGRQN